ncbi:MAG: acetolactate synthase small subunit [Bacteroidales bacterium]|nr:acetolactate synthase small subunit [Bacteroidales bacterium]
MNDNKTLYTITIFSENTVGVLNQITTIFTRRQLNIETLSVSPSAIEGIHKFTITTFTNDEEVMKKLVRLIDKRVDILKAYYNTDEDLVHQELALYKLSTEKVMEHGSIEYFVRKYNVRILEVSVDCVVFLKAGHFDETQGLFEELSSTIGVLQFVRSGRIAITKSKVERLSDMLAKREEQKSLLLATQQI